MSDLPIRAELVGQTAYGAPQINVAVRLNTNENPFAPSEDLLADLAEAARSVGRAANRYPDRDCELLRDDLAGYLREQTGAGVTPANVWPANGSNECLQQILQAFGGAGRTALGFPPTYSMHELISRGTATDWIPAPRADDFSLAADVVVAAIRTHRPDVTFLCSPNNPTGDSLPAQTVIAAYDAMAETDRGILIVDEAYAEFSSRPSAVTLLPQRPRLLVTRTMSKAFAFAAGRVGYVVADAGVIDVLQLVRLPYHLSAFSQAAARVALAYRATLHEQVVTLSATRDRFVADVRAAGWRVHAADANFVLIGEFTDQREAWRRLMEQGVLVRDVNLPGWLRVTVGTDDDMSALTTALATIEELRQE